MTENDETLERVIATLKEPVTIDPAFDARVLAAIEHERKVAGRSAVAWLTRSWTLRVSPLGGLAAAAAIAGVAFATALVILAREEAPLAATHAAATGVVTPFVLVAGDAGSVALVGDFNDWDLSATTLARQPGDGVWWVSVELPPGRYRYAFVVDGTRWRPDPNAPAAEDDFGRPNSVVTIGGA